MPVKFLNKANINLPMAIWLLNDKYDHINEPNYISATGLLKPIQEQVLMKQNKVNTDVIEIEIGDFAQNRDGSAMHDSIESAWANPHAVRTACELLGIPDEVVKSLVVNPTQEHFDIAETQNRKITPVYMEQRSMRELDGWKIGGKYDLILAGDLHDYKKTGTFTYVHQTNTKKYIQQGSIYRWLNPEKITNDILTINYYFTDWSKFKTTNPKYPQHRIMSQHFTMMSLDETEQFIKGILKQLDHYEKNPTDPLPKCTDEQLWKGETEYKYFSNPTAERATKNFGSDAAGAHSHMALKGKGIVKDFPAIAKACNYCPALPYCPQAAQLIKNKQLAIK